MWIQVGNLQSKLTRATDHERGWLMSYLTFEGKRIGRKEPKQTMLFNIFTSTFPAGFTGMIVKAAALEDPPIQVQLIDNRVAPCLPDALADLAWLRDYQQKAVEIAVKRKRGILWLPTGSGKTEIIVGITRALPCKWISLVHRSQLADDIASRWEKRTPGLRAGRVLEGRFDVQEDDQLVSCTYQSLRAALEKPGTREHMLASKILNEAEGLFVDECHTAPAETYNEILMKTRSAYYRIGLSGTPLARNDAKSQHAIAAIGPVVYQIKPQRLIDEGVLAKPTVRMSTVVQGSSRQMWDGVYKELIVRSKVRNAKVIDQVKRATKPAFCFVEQTEHGKTLEKMIFQAGMTATFVWGSHSVDYRKSIIRRLVLGHFDVIVCSRVFNEGIDVPELRSVVNAGGMKSIIATLQRLGRGMRVDKDAAGVVRAGGDVFEVYDIFDEGQKWTAEHARTRRDAYIAEGYETFIEPPAIVTSVVATTP